MTRQERRAQLRQARRERQLEARTGLKPYEAITIFGYPVRDTSRWQRVLVVWADHDAMLIYWMGTDFTYHPEPTRLPYGLDHEDVAWTRGHNLDSDAVRALLTAMALRDS